MREHIWTYGALLFSGCKWLENLQKEILTIKQAGTSLSYQELVRLELMRLEGDVQSLHDLNLQLTAVGRMCAEITDMIEAKLEKL